MNTVKKLQSIFSVAGTGDGALPQVMDGFGAITPPFPFTGRLE
ncbi:hypothetical protein [Brevibacillus sp. SIMBA_076]